MEITKKITSVKVNEGTTKEVPVEAPVKPSKALKREYVLKGRTYKLKPPTASTAMYITINDYNSKPFEIFIESKDVTHEQWTTALTRTLSAAFRKEEAIQWLIDELKQVHDPKGGYFFKGKYHPSLVANIGSVIEEHVSNISNTTGTTVHVTEEELPNTGLQCPKCNQFTLVKNGGCTNCINPKCNYEGECG